MRLITRNVIAAERISVLPSNFYSLNAAWPSNDGNLNLCNSRNISSFLLNKTIRKSVMMGESMYLEIRVTLGFA